jgi:glycosyltransferase involved in cell wall biosynthesis
MANGVDCTVLSPARGDSTPSLPEGATLELVTEPRMGLLQIRLGRLVRPLGRLRSGPFAERVRVLARDADVVHFVEAEAAATIDLVERPAVAQLHCLTRKDPRVWNPLRPGGRNSIEALRGELRVRRHARWLLVNSADVAGTLASSHSDVTVAPLSLDPAHYLPRATLDSPLVGLIGTAYWPPTAVAVERLLRTVWPLVLERRADARLVLAGESMVRERFAHIPEPPGVEWRGRVPVASDFLRELGVLCYPVTAGSGMKVKVLEAMAMGVPVVTTPEGAEGLAANAGVTVETDDMRLAQATISLLEDADRRLALGAEAHAGFMLHHTPAVAAKPVVDLYRRMLT